VNVTTATVAPAITGPAAGALPGGTVGVQYGPVQINGTGTPAPTWSILAGGALPNGLTIDSATGVISGTPIAAGTFNFTVSATNGVGTPATRAYSIVIAPAAPTGIVLTPEFSDPDDPWRPSEVKNAQEHFADRIYFTDISPGMDFSEIALLADVIGGSNMGPRFGNIRGFVAIPLNEIVVDTAGVTVTNATVNIFGESRPYGSSEVYIGDINGQPHLISKILPIADDLGRFDMEDAQAVGTEFKMTVTLSQGSDTADIVIVNKFYFDFA
jgi:hypothetical protein